MLSGVREAGSDDGLVTCLEDCKEGCALTESVSLPSLKLVVLHKVIREKEKRQK